MSDLTGLAILFFLVYPFLAAWLFGARHLRRLDLLYAEVAHLRRQLDGMKVPDPPAPAAPPETATPVAPVDVAVTRPAVHPEASRPNHVPPMPTTGATGARPVSSPARSTPPPAPATPKPPFSPPPWLVAARRWMLAGNPVAKLGLAILFLGVAFALKYVAETVVIPIELRLAALVLADLSLLAWGWRIRDARREIGLPVQGTAIAVLMLVVFGASQYYRMIPDEAALAGLVLLTVATCMLALLQDAFWLAAFGIAGGFACPLVLGVTHGNPSVLFSYYALMNAGVFALAIRRAWRPLNLIGFAFTFIVGASWGGLRYAPDNYGLAQGFLILFFLFYVGISLAFARQRQARLKDYVDAVLVLGTPLLAFGLQAALVRNMPFGLALSALALGAFYLLLGMHLWRRDRIRWLVLVETCLALGTVFATLAIPFAVDGRWTSAAWALEGAGFVWLGLRRRQPRIWAAGLILQLGAWLSFIAVLAGLDDDAARRSNLLLGFVLLAGSTFAMASNFRKHGQAGSRFSAPAANGFLAIAAVWLLAGMWVEIVLRAEGSSLVNLLVASAILTAVVLNLLSARQQWVMARRLALLAQLAGALAFIVVSALYWEWLLPDIYQGEKPWVGALMLAVAALVSHRQMRHALSGRRDRQLSAALLLAGGFWWFGPVLNVASGHLASWLPYALGTTFARWSAAYDLCVVASAIAFAQLALRVDWAQARWLATTCWAILVLVTLTIVPTLYATWTLPDPGYLFGWALLWGGTEYLLTLFRARQWPLGRRILCLLHAVRMGGPWLAIWPVGAIVLADWLTASMIEQSTIAAKAGWSLSGAWSIYLPAWAMMLVLAWLMRRTGPERWPTAPLGDWYRRMAIPAATTYILVLVASWNLLQDGGMAPLPYVPLLNPLDLSTGIALMLGVEAARAMVAEVSDAGTLRRRLRLAGAVGAYSWLNLIVLRSAGHYLDIPYRIEELLASQAVQAMLSLTWCASAMVLMRHAARRNWRSAWHCGAIMLALVVIKLFAIDLAGGGSMARIVSFVGVGLLMLLIGYFAPYPKTVARQAA